MPSRSTRPVRTVQFSDFELDMRSAELRKNGEPVRLQEQPMRILIALLERPGETVSREEVRKRLWPNDTAVEVSHGINAAVQRLRDALGESAESPQYIQTVPRRGYRFIAPVKVQMGSQPAPLPPSDPENLQGKSVSHFRVMEKLGGGGMGVVYRAEDLTLGRQVALKFLPREHAGDPGAVSRFRREAQAASSLNHPNICTIYGVEECEGRPVIVMEMLEGETLEAILARGPLTVAAAVGMAIQIAAALEAAHGAGIVHRDIKPGNILVGKSGLKVLDFGLAKMDRPVGLSLEQPAYLTQAGTILGTLHYMSPEQVQGHDADPASDIFSFGAVLYEMLAARRPFDAPNTARVLAEILAVDPPPFVRLVPVPLDSLVRRCLAKEPVERWPSASEIKAQLERFAAAPRTIALPAPKFHWRAVGIVLAVCLSMAGVAYFAMRSMRSTAVPVEIPPAIATPVAIPAPTAPAPARRQSDTPPPLAEATVMIQSGTAARPALSPDGRHIAFFDMGHLYVRQLDSAYLLDLGPITGTPFWAPDSRSVAATAGKFLTRFDLEGNGSRQICPSNTNLPGAWGPDGTILLGLIRDGIYRVSASGGELVRITQVDTAQKETRHLTPQFLPDGKHFLYVRASSDRERNMLYVGTLPSGEGKAIMPAGSNVAFVPNAHDPNLGYLISVMAGSLVSKQFNLTTLTADSSAFPLGESATLTTAADAAFSTAEFSVTPTALAVRGVADRGILLIRNWMTRLPK